MNRRSIVVVENFYSDPDAVRAYALRQKYYSPYETDDMKRTGFRPRWWTSWYKGHNECPFKSSADVMGVLEDMVGEKIDREYWNASFPVDDESKPAARLQTASLWNGAFHYKMKDHQPLGYGIHNHVTDIWNSVGLNGWAGLIYMSPDAPIDGGLNLWRNVNPENEFDWMSPPENWNHLDKFANCYNRMILVRGDIPHSGAVGWGHDIRTSRLFQTFFFRTTTDPQNFSVPVSRLSL